MNTNTTEPESAPDRLLEFPYGLERATALRLERAGKIVFAKLGRRKVARQSNILALVPTERTPPPQPGSTDYDAIVARRTQLAKARATKAARPNRPRDGGHGA